MPYWSLWINNRKIFKYRLVYYLALITSLVFFIISIFPVLSLFENLSIFNLIIICIPIVINVFACINLIEKYDKAVFFLNLGLSLYIIFTGYYVLLGFLSDGLYGMVKHTHFKLLIIILIVVNIFKVENYKECKEIKNIGQKEE